MAGANPRYLANAGMTSYLGDMNERFDRIEGALVGVMEATEAGFAGVTSMFEILHDRMTVLEGQMNEALGRLRIIGERLATHTHEEGD